MAERFESQNPEEKIANVESFDALYEALKEIGTISGSHRVYDSETLIRKIEAMRSQEVAPLLLITNALGLREKVRQLLQKEA